MFVFVPFLGILFLLFAIGFNTSMCDAASMTFDVVGTMGSVAAVCAVLALFLWWLSSIGSERCDAPLAALGAPRRGPTETLSKTTTTVEKDVVVDDERTRGYESAPLALSPLQQQQQQQQQQKQQQPAWYQHRRRPTRATALATTRCACGYGADRCLCDLARKSRPAVSRSLEMQMEEVKPAMTLYQVHVSNETNTSLLYYLQPDDYFGEYPASYRQWGLPGHVDKWQTSFVPRYLRIEDTLGCRSLFRVPFVDRTHPTVATIYPVPFFENANMLGTYKVVYSGKDHAEVMTTSRSQCGFPSNTVGLAPPSPSTVSRRQGK